MEHPQDDHEKSTSSREKLEKSGETSSSNSKNGNLMLLKWIFYLIVVTFVHFYFCYRIPSRTKKAFILNPYLLGCYTLFALYFFFTALQIRYGYPDITKELIFTESTDLHNRILFKIFRAIPFLFELRAILDWTITRTSLDLFQWLKLEDAYAQLFLVKCEMDVRREHESGSARSTFEKFIYGFLMVLLLLLIILGPILLFSTLNPILEMNNVNTGSVTIYLSSSSANKAASLFKLYEIQNPDISGIDAEQFAMARKAYTGIEEDWNPLMQKVTLPPFSESVWDITPPNFRLLKSLFDKDDEKFYLTVDWSFSRPHPPGGETAHGSNTIMLSDRMKKGLQRVFDQEDEGFVLDVPNLFPKFLRLGPTANTKIQRIGRSTSEPYSHVMTGCVLQYKKEQGQKYWGINTQARQGDKKYDKVFKVQDKSITMVLISDQVVGSIFSKNGMELSVIGLYATIVLAIGRFVRLIFDKISQRVIYEEMPRTTDLMEFCDGIYIARLEGDLKREQSMYDLLIKLYRSPELLLKLTADKER